tara:strand:- start:167011 stop:167265 length:255 start_codon:yes stop_codon:yes gene_type:complete
MECPKCQSKAIVIDTKNFRYKAGEPLTQVRIYACTNWDCLNAFTYRNTYLDEVKRRDVAKFLKRYEREQRLQETQQHELEIDED